MEVPRNQIPVEVLFTVCPKLVPTVQGKEKLEMERGFVPEQVVPPEHEPEITPVFVIASAPPNTRRVKLSSEMPVPAVTAPVVEA